MSLSVKCCVPQKEFFTDNIDYIAEGFRIHLRTFPVSTCNGMHTTTLPSQLYFFERAYDDPKKSLDWTLDWPWGFWSIDPEDTWKLEDIGLITDAHRSREGSRHSIVFDGITPDGVRSWTQIVNGCMFCIEARWVT